MEIKFTSPNAAAAPLAEGTVAPSGPATPAPSTPPTPPAPVAGGTQVIAGPPPGNSPVIDVQATQVVQTEVLRTGSSPLLPATVPPAQLPATQGGGFFDDDSMRLSDWKIPRFVIVQKSGELSNTFKPGTLLLDKSLVLADSGGVTAESAMINVLIVGFDRVRFSERVPGGIGGRILDTEAEVVAAGGTTDWNTHQISKQATPLFQSMTTAMILIEKPENVGPEMFQLPLGGKQYALALYTMRGGSYTNGAAVIKSARRIGHIRGGYRTGFWKLSSKHKVVNSNTVWNPMFRPSVPASVEFQAELKTVLGF